MSPFNSILLATSCLAVLVASQMLATAGAIELDPELSQQLLDMDEKLDDNFLLETELIQTWDMQGNHKCYGMLSLVQQLMGLREDRLNPGSPREVMSPSQRDFRELMDDFLLLMKINYLISRRTLSTKIEDERKASSSWLKCKGCFKSNESKSLATRRRQLMDDAEELIRYCGRLFGVIVSDHHALTKEQAAEVKRFRLSSEPENALIVKKINWITYLREQVLSLERQRCLNQINKQEKILNDKIDERSKVGNQGLASKRPELNTKLIQIEQSKLDGLFELLKTLNSDLENVQNYGDTLINSAIRSSRGQ